MTLRARPTTKPVNRRRGSHDDSRRTLYTNLAFVGVIVLAVLLFAGAAFAGWYSQHLAAAATVNGVAITKDQVAERIKIENFRLKSWDDQVHAKVTAGRIPGSQAQALISYIQSIKSNIDTAALGYEEDSELVRQLAAKRSVSISDADLDAQLTKDATSPESRHVFAITIKPEVATGTTVATDAQKQAARQKAESLLAGLRSGTSWEDTVKASGDTTAATTNGDLYFLDKETTSPDAAFVTAIFALSANGYTDVIEGSDGAFRIGRLTEIVPSSVDPNYQQAIRDFGIDMGAYRNFDRSLVAHDRLAAQILSEVVDNPSEQRKAVKIVLNVNNGQPAAPNAVLVKHILFSPNDNPTGASALKPDDPGWATAKQAADDAYAKLSAGTARFVDLAATSDDTGSAAQNGFLGFYAKDDPNTPALDPAFADAIYKPGLTTGQLLPPVKSGFGWHVIQIAWAATPAPTASAAPTASVTPGASPATAGPTATAAPAASATPGASPAADLVESYVKAVAAEAVKPGADLAKIAADNSIDPTAATGGDMGWIAKYQLGQDEESLIFALAKGAASDPAGFVGSDGYSTYARFYVVTDVATRAPDAKQAATLRASAFSNWYLAIKADPAQADIVEGDGGAPAASP